MPQGRRKVPFSAKQKKEQLKLKRFSKASRYEDSDDDSEREQKNKRQDYHTATTSIQKINFQSSSNNLRSAQSNTNRYALMFRNETKEEIETMKEEAYRSIEICSQQNFHIGDEYFRGFDFPLRPKWSYEMSKEDLNRNENRYFTEYVNTLIKKHLAKELEVSLFEMNLETWRQLWRVLELSDILVTVVDARFPSFMFSPALYKYATETLKKPLLVILNKSDLTSKELVSAWREYFAITYPLIKVIPLSSRPRSKRGKTKESPEEIEASIQLQREGIYELYKACHEIVDGELDLTVWHQKIIEDSKLIGNDAGDGERRAPPTFHTIDKNDSEYTEHEKYKNGTLSLGFIGFPNAGKSSVINAIKGRKVVSVSRTPGHTKHFQTIFLTPTVRVCDCPGLVFPSSTPKCLQVLIGSYPIAQLRQPYPSIKFLAERVDLTSVLNIKLPPDSDAWSASIICEMWALKRGFITAKAGRPDHYRAANNILRMVLDGSVPFKVFPPGYSRGLEDDVSILENFKNTERSSDESDSEEDESCSASEEEADAED